MHVNKNHIRFVLHQYCVNAVVSMSLLSPYCVLVRSRPHYDFFEQYLKKICQKTCCVTSEKLHFYFTHCVQIPRIDLPNGVFSTNWDTFNIYKLFNINSCGVIFDGVKLSSPSMECPTIP